MIIPQYTYDSTGKKTGVFLPIDDWNELQQVPGVGKLSQQDVPEWQVELGRKELKKLEDRNAELLSWEKSKEHFKL